jgi:hypothetical protein
MDFYPAMGPVRRALQLKEQSKSFPRMARIDADGLE